MPPTPLPTNDWPPRDPEIMQALEAAFASGGWGKYHGPSCDQLRAALCHLHGVDHAWLCSSGTIAVELALRGLKIGADDEVLLAGYDFPGNFRAIEAVGATPALVDIAPATWCLDAALVEAAIGDKTRGIVVSHLHGGIADMRTLREIADRHSIAIIEDACQNPGAIVQGKPAGTWGDVGIMSFGGSKLLTAGRGGAVLTSRADVVQRIKIYTERGNDAFPLSELQAAVLVPQLQRLAARNQIRQRAVDMIRHACAKLAALELVAAAGTESSAAFFKVGFRYAAPAEGVTREQFAAELQRAGVTIGEGFRGFAKRSTRRCRAATPLTHASDAASSTLVLHHPILLADEATLQQLIEVLGRASTLQDNGS